MPDHIYKQIELTGSSTASLEAAVENAVAKASETIHSLRWFQVTEIRGHIEDGAIGHWQATLKLGFTVD